MNDKRLAIGWIVAAALLVLVIVLAERQSGQPPETESEERPLPSPSAVSGQTLEPAGAPGLCERPYPDDSIWNVPLDWSVAKVHPQSDLMMDAFFEGSDWIGTDTSQYTPNVYIVSKETPLVTVRLEKNRFRDAISDFNINFGEPAGVVQMPLPLGALPAVGTDGQLVVINKDTGEEWGLNKGSVDSLGNWTAGGVYRYSIENSGIPPEGFGQRGAGIGQLAGIVRRCEVDQGRIEHAVTIAYDYPCAPEVCALNGWPASVPPFRKTDGEGTSRYDIPEGARLAIRPEVTRQEIAEVCDGIKGCELWVEAMQRYGGFIVDKSDHPKSYAEGNVTALWDDSLWTKNMLRNIPTDWYVVIDWNSPATKAR